MANSLPSWNKVRLTGKYADAKGTPLTGSILFTPSVRVADVTDRVMVVPVTFEAVLDADGAFSIELPATDDPDIVPSGFTYTVVEEITGGQRYSIELSITAPPEGIDLTLAAHAMPIPAVVTYVTFAQLNQAMASGELNGASAYDVAVSNGYTGSQADWLLSLKGTPGGSNTQATARKMADQYGDVTLCFLGDSTVAIWLPSFLSRLAALYPHRSIRTYKWNDTTRTYAAPVTAATGTGTTWINVYDGSKGGTVWEFALIAPDPHWAVLQPDAFVISYGLNQGNTSLPAVRVAYGVQWQRLAAEVKALCPSTDLLLVSQNPRIDAGYQADLATVRAQLVRTVAAEMGAAYGPVTEAYLASDSVAALLNADGIHPNTAGSALYADTLIPMLRVQDNVQPGTRVPSPLLVPGISLATNGDFSRFDGTTTGLTGWTAVNAILSKDTAHFESAKGYSVRIQPASAAQSRIEQMIPVSEVAGKVITVAARMRIPAGQGIVTGRVTIITTGGATPLGVQSQGTGVGLRDVFFWEYLTVRIPVDAATVKVQIISGATTEATADVSVDRVSAVLGGVPRDVVPPVPAPTALYPGLRRFKSARYYAPDPHTVGAATITAGWAFVTPIFVPALQQFVSMAAEVTTPAAGATLRLGIYGSDAFDQPSGLLLDAGAIDASTAGVKELAISQTLAPGWYWLATLVLGANIAVRSLSGPSHPLVVNTLPTLVNLNNAYLATGQAALPATWVANAAAVGPPKVLLKTA